jgi:hypothetical protein
MLCGLVFGVVIATVIGAIILRAACSLYNKIVGGSRAPGAVPDPGFGKAMAIVFVATLVNFVLSFIIGMVGAVGAVHPAVVQLICLPVGYLVLAGMTTAMLPTDFPKALLIALLYVVIGICVVVVIAVVVGVVVAIFAAAG